MGNNPILISTGQRIRAVRVHFEENQGEFCRKVSINQSFLSEIENDKRMPPKNMISKLFLIYNVREEWILGGRGEMFVSKVGCGSAFLNEVAKLLGLVIFCIKEYMNTRKLTFTAMVETKITMTFLKFFLEHSELDKKAIRHHIETSFNMVARAASKGDYEKNFQKSS